MSIVDADVFEGALNYKITVPGHKFPRFLYSLGSRLSESFNAGDRNGSFADNLTVCIMGGAGPQMPFVSAYIASGALPTKKGNGLRELIKADPLAVDLHVGQHSFGQSSSGAQIFRFGGHSFVGQHHSSGSIELHEVSGVQAMSVHTMPHVGISIQPSSQWEELNSVRLRDFNAALGLRARMDLVNLAYKTCVQEHITDHKSAFDRALQQLELSLSGLSKGLLVPEEVSLVVGIAPGFAERPKVAKFIQEQHLVPVEPT